ncbi:hypothetical protein EIP91_009652 [Steccherinum ochraceum]|uniref:FAD/NAD(P)-binding domain-containing protein n=1 Tax=Steccherinum ochraceum TaxID=92696 RepID=A0A4R0R9G6_9APHY|nr:hypothetical protein EIP91_009652 [Steccherinum ochraceum]
MKAAKQQSICILGAGPAGLITAHTLLQDGFENVSVLTRDRTPGGVWAAERVYPGLTLNNVHGEYRFSQLPMPPPRDAKATGGRLRGEDLRDYFASFADRFLKGKISYNTEVLRVQKSATSGEASWRVTTRSQVDGETRELVFNKFVMCTGGCSEPSIPRSLEAAAASTVGFAGPVVHSSQIASNQPAILDAAKHLNTPDPGHILVIGGGKSAQDAASFFAKLGRKVTILFDNADAIVAAPIPLPEFIRKSRFLAVASPYITLRTRLERFLHTTWLGSKITHGLWSFLEWSSFLALNVPSNSPLRKSHSVFWAVRTNDEGNGGSDRFHGLVNAGKIQMVAPARATRYLEARTTKEGRNVVVVETSDGGNVEADAVVLATGYKSSWGPLFDEDTRKDLGLDPQPVPYSNEFDDYVSLAHPPQHHHDREAKHCLIYRGLIPAKTILNRDFAINGAAFSTNPGYTYEVAAHWISSYFLSDPFLHIPPTVQDASDVCLRYNAWLRKRHPDMLAEINESYSSVLSFWSWPQMADELLEDMELPSMRSGGNWLTWVFKVVDLKEIKDLRGEREQKRLACQ